MEALPSQPEIESWLVSHLATILEIAPEQVDTTIPFESYGLDSEAAIVISGDIQDWLGCSLEPTLLFDYPTIESLSQYLSEH
jgi:acyl carrier protein